MEMGEIMTKDVLLSLRGLQFDASSTEGDRIETITPAEYYKRNNSHFVIFDEATEGFGETTKNIIRFREDSLDLTKRGLVNVHMIFEKDKKNMASYVTPYGEILIGIDARGVHLEEKENRIVVDVDYALEVNYEHFADCRIRMDIRSKEGERLSLQS